MTKLQLLGAGLAARRAVLLGLLLLGGVAAGDEVVKVYQDPAFNATVSKILVVGVHEDLGVRGQFENTIARAVRSVGASSEASFYSVSGIAELTAEALVAAARKTRADAVLVTRVVDVQTQDVDAATFPDYFRSYSRYGDPLPGDGDAYGAGPNGSLPRREPSTNLGRRIDGVRETEPLRRHRRHRQRRRGAASQRRPRSLAFATVCRAFLARRSFGGLLGA